jgi:hypothetical protein
MVPARSKKKREFRTARTWSSNRAMIPLLRGKGTNELKIATRESAGGIANQMKPLSEWIHNMGYDSGRQIPDLVHKRGHGWGTGGAGCMLLKDG